MSAVLIASITDLCTADHGNDPAVIAAWTANKSPDPLAEMMAEPDARFFLAESDGRIGAVGCIVSDSQVGLLYVDPAARFAGLSTALLAAMEAEMRAAGTRAARLESTLTAHDFYRARGWEDDGCAPDRFGLACVSMRKAL
jgi:GNAT superfamily N-acetyltransferase